LVLHGLYNNIRLTDSHIHLADLEKWEPINNSPVCSCAASLSEMKKLVLLKNQYPNLVYSAFGIHPQNIDLNNVLILDELLASNSINAIGEIGFDFFTKELASTFDIQQEAFNIQIELAIKFSKPVIIHCRKGMDKIFIYSKQLSKLPAVIFHSFSGSSVEGNSLLKKGINCFFSFGKSLLKEKNRCIQCAKELPLERILAETDAPFHKLPLEKTTLPSDIILVYKEISKIKEIFLEEISLEVEKNFYNAFG